MAYSYDGYLRFNTEVDQSGFNNGISGMQSAATLGGKAIAAGIAAATGAITALSAYAVTVGSDFEAAMSTVAATSQASAADMELLTEKAKEMGATTKFTATESAEALNFMAQAGWQTQAMLEGLPGVMNLAAASGEDLASVSDIVTDAMTAFGMQASESGHFADVLAQAAAASNTDVAKMGATFKYVAPVAGSLKYAIEDTAVAIGLMANAGIKGEMAGTQLRAVLSRLVNPTKDSEAAMKDLGLSIKNSDGSMKDFASILVDLRSGMAKFADDQKASYAAMLGGQEAMSGLLAIANASEADFQNLTNAINSADGAAEEMAKTVNDNLKGDLTILGSTAESVGIKMYEKFQEPMRNAAKAATESLGEVLQSLNGGQLDKSVDKIADSAGRLLAKTAELTANGLPKLLDGFTYVIDHGDEVKSTILGIASAVGIYKTSMATIKMYQSSQVLQILTPTIESWRSAKVAVDGYKAAMVASNAVSATGKSVGLLLASTMTTQQLAYGGLTGAIGLNTVATTLGAKAHAAFNAVIAANPIGAAALALGALTAAVMYYTSKQEDSNAMTREMIDTTYELAAAWEKAKEARMQDVQSQFSELQTTSDMIGELGLLTDSYGKVGENKERVAYLTQKINELLPDSVKWVDDETIAIDGNIESLKKQIQLKQAKILLDELEAQIAEDREAITKSIEKQIQYEKEIAAQEAEIARMRIEASKAVSDTTASYLQMQIDAREKHLEETKTAFDTEKRYYEEMNRAKDDAAKLEIAIMQGDFEEVTRITVQRELQLKAAGDSTIEELNRQIADTKERYDLLVRNYSDGTSEAIQTEKAELSRLIGEYQAELSKRVPAVANTMYQNAEKIGLSYASGLISKEVLSQIKTNSILLGNAVSAGTASAFGNQATKETNPILDRAASAKASISAVDSALAVAREAQKAQEKALSSIGSGLSSAAAGASKKAEKAAFKMGELHVENIAAGITNSKDAIQESIATLSAESIESAKGKSTSYKELGTLYMDMMKTGINAQTDSAVKQMENIVDAQTEAFGEKNKDAKTEYEKAAKELMNTYKDALKAGADEANTIVSEKIKGITEEAQKQYDEIIRQRDKLEQKLSGYGELFTRDEDGKVQLENLDKQTDALKRYEKALEELQEKGISDGLLNEILNMGIEDGTDYAEKLLKNTNAFEKVNEAWTLKQETIKTIAEKFYADELETLDQNFTQELDTALASIPEECTDVGVDAIKGVIDGMNSQKADAIQTARDIADAIIKELKRATETASPSKRAAREVGKPLTQGIIKGMNDAYDPQELQSYTDRMMVDIGHSQAKAAQNVSYLNTSSIVNSATYNNGGNLTVMVDKIVNDGKGSVKSAMQEFEFYRRQQATATGGA